MTTTATTHRTLTLPFLGQRVYLQGTTLLDGLLPLVPSRTDLSLRLPRILRTDRVRVDTRPAPDAGPPHAVLTHSRGAGRIEVRPLAPSAEIARVPHDEGPLWDSAHFTTGSVRLDLPSPFTFVATCVSLNKAMLLRDAPPTGPGQWLFTGIDLVRHPDRFLPLELHREALVAGRMAKTALAVGGEGVGALYFAWVESIPEVS